MIILHFKLDKINEIYSLSFKMTKETKLSIFQFKIIHNVLPHRVLLYKMKITDSDLCLYCGSQETLQHLWVSCPLLRTFWSDVLTWLNSNSTCNILVRRTQDFVWLQFWRPKVSSLKLLHFNCKISNLQVQDRFQIPYFSSLYGIIERKTTRLQSGCRSKQDFTKIANKMDNSLTLVG